MNRYQSIINHELSSFFPALQGAESEHEYQSYFNYALRRSSARFFKQLSRDGSSGTGFSGKLFEPFLKWVWASQKRLVWSFRRYSREVCGLFPQQYDKTFFPTSFPTSVDPFAKQILSGATVGTIWSCQVTTILWRIFQVRWLHTVSYRYSIRLPLGYPDVRNLESLLGNRC